ncbi:MAG: type IV toxin-antitoxin system AbiEi family antitoxin domain-containing protein [Actinomycetota bacterium]
MKPTDAFGDLLRLRRSIIETREVAVRLGLSISRASQLLHSLEESGLVRRLRRGLWALHPDVDPFSVPPYLTAPFPAYVSFWSALARHGMIEQVPRQIFVASLDRTRRVTTTVGTYSIHHLAPEVFDGYDGSEEVGYLATPEKALFDTVYLRAAGGGQTLLPELELPDGFQEDKVEEWTSRVARPRLRTLVSRGLAKALAGAARSGATPSSEPGDDAGGPHI